MVEKVICFKGARNMGKSGAIRKVLNDYFKIVIVEKKEKDFCIYFYHKNKKIGICSVGDDLEVLKNLIRLMEENCYIIICASHLRDKLRKEIEKIFAGYLEDIPCSWDRNASDNIKDRINNERLKDFKVIADNYFG